MDIVQAVSGYVTKMVSTGDSASGSPAKMKILLLDTDTVGLLLLGLIVAESMLTLSKGVHHLLRDHSIRPPQP